MRRICTATLVAFVAVLLFSDPASAHGATGATASNFRTRITAVRPAVENVSVQVKENGDRLQLRNESKAEIIVLGYQNEPYLKVTKNGVWQNHFSPAVYTNTNRYGDVETPPFADPAKPAQWERVSSGNVAVWHDHRAHWMSSTPPPIVLGDRTHAHVVIPDFEVPFTVDGKPGMVTGTVEWTPPLAKWKWGSVVLASAAIVAAVALLRSKASAVALGTVALVTADVIHVTGTFVGGAGRLQTRMAGALTADITSVVAWCTGLWVLWAIAKKQREVITYAGLFTAIVLCLFGGVTDAPTMWDSQVVSHWPSWLARSAVAVTVGAGMATAVTCALLVDRLRTRTRSTQAADRNNRAAADH